MTGRQSARSVADVAGGLILATVDIAAPPERVFRALTQSEEIVRWWGSPERYTTESWTADLRVGGAWKATGRSVDGTAFSVSGTFLAIEPPHKVVLTWKPEWEAGLDTIVTYQLASIENGTRVTVRHEGFGDRVAACEDHTSGWEIVLGWLSRHVLEARSAAYESFYFCRLLPPRASFAHDMTADEAAMMQAHSAYWREKQREGFAIVFGPVADPQGPWGLGVVRVAGDAQMRAFEAADPAIQSGKGFRYETLPMIQAVVTS